MQEKNLSGNVNFCSPEFVARVARGLGAAVLTGLIVVTPLSFVTPVADAVGSTSSPGVGTPPWIGGYVGGPGSGYHSDQTGCCAWE
jgi:hypothetical protein